MEKIFLSTSTTPRPIISLQTRPARTSTANLHGIKAYSLLLKEPPTVHLNLANTPTTLQTGTLTAVDCHHGVLHVRNFTTPIGKYSAALIRLNDCNRLDCQVSPDCFDNLLRLALASDATPPPPRMHTNLPPSSPSSPSPTSLSTVASFARDAEVRKYWSQRYHLFSLFDSIQTDREGLFSATPECVAQHVAARVRENTRTQVVWDAFAGVGGNCCHFSAFDTIIATDLNEQRLQMCRNNCQVYGVQQIEFRTGNFLDLCTSIRADVVILSPPWGGPKYLDVNEATALELSNIVSIPCDGVQLFRLGIDATLPGGTTVYMLPKNVNKQSIMDVRMALGGGAMEIEDMYVNGVLKMTIAYYSKKL